ncbi:hypothetical protein [Aestuariispira ectoiniformans]|uniref:hypothetical protein n=1 Tax=Aestuariispira ectoiniformans TaxID=2775080 RepID=UPI00223C2A06|nr:hypothetical protein [Aestuariispira ectoiniformans]
MNALNNLFIPGETHRGAADYETTVEINPDDALFDVHFPNMPIVPGACLIGYAAHCISQWAEGDRITVQSVPRAVFNSPVVPGMKLKLQVVLSSKADGQGKAVCRYLSDQGMSAQVVLEFSSAGGE